MNVKVDFTGRKVRTRMGNAIYTVRGVYLKGKDIMGICTDKDNRICTVTLTDAKLLEEEAVGDSRTGATTVPLDFLHP